MEEIILHQETRPDVRIDLCGCCNGLRLRQGGRTNRDHDFVEVSEDMINLFVKDVLSLYGKTCTISKKGRGQ